MTNGNINQIMSGEKDLDKEPWENYPIDTIPE